MQKNFILLKLFCLFLLSSSIQASQPNYPTKLSAKQQSVKAQLAVNQLFQNKDISKLNIPEILASMMKQFPLVGTVRIQGTVYHCYQLKDEFLVWTSNTNHRTPFTAVSLRELHKAGEISYDKSTTKNNPPSLDISTQNPQTPAPTAGFRATRRQRDEF